MKHTSKVKGFEGTTHELATQVGDLFYDSMAEFLNQLADKIQLDGEADFNRGRKKLANELFESSQHLRSAANNISNAWDICSPFVDEWLEKHGIKRP